MSPWLTDGKYRRRFSARYSEKGCHAMPGGPLTFAFVSYVTPSGNVGTMDADRWDAWAATAVPCPDP